MPRTGHPADGFEPAVSVTAGEAVSLHFRDGDRQAVVEGDTPEMATAPKARAKQPKPPTTGQGDLF